MTLNEYQKAAARTINTEMPKEETGDMVILGLIGETGEVAELIKKDRFHGKPLNVGGLIEEAGDVLWYTAAEFTGSKIEISIIGKSEFKELDDFVSERPLNDTECVLAIYGTLSAGDTTAAANRMCLLSRILQNHGSTLAEAADVNIAKLLARYPDGFKKGGAA